MLLQNKINESVPPVLNNRSIDFCYKETDSYFNDIMSIRRKKINDNFNR
jgi:hypothetical protein